MKCTFREFLEILLRSGFVEQRVAKGSHRRFRSVVDGQVRLVTFAPHNINDEIKLGTLKSMIRQSGLPEALFRK
ncbi:MAG: type II toxin-antitoxin system HicA family toxin [Alphaproteobacteria bacterium]|nr:type II toxin-antitoxin system HicA family toxin [Alphaproteobacteria bacterium]